MKKILLGAIFTSLLALVGCSQENENSTAGGSEPTITFKVGHILPDTHPTHTSLVEMGDDLAQVTNQRVKLDVMGNGILGTHNELISQVATGALHMALIPGISPFQGLDARLGVEEIPFLFKTREEAYKAVDGKFGDKVSEILRGHKIQVLSYWENGFRHFTNNTRPIVKVKDMQGIRFRSDSSKMRLEMFKAMGASAVSMSFGELFTGLQQGTVNGQENPLSIISSANFFEVQKYLSLSGHLWGAGVLIINPDVYSKLSEEDQKSLMQLASKHRDKVRESLKAYDDKLVSDLREKGMQINEVDKDDFADAAAKAEQVYVRQNGDELLKLIKDNQ